MEDNKQSSHDAFLALRCQTGDDVHAFRDLVAEFERPLHYFIAKLIGNETESLDVLQQVWLRAFRRIRSLRHPAQLRAWLYGIARGLAIDHLRKQQTLTRHELDYAADNPESIHDTTFDTATAEALHLGLDQLELRLREVLVLHFLEEMSLNEVAEIVGCPIGTVKSRLFHAKRQLRLILERTND